jgi:hypothetical protein
MEHRDEREGESGERGSARSGAWERHAVDVRGTASEDTHTHTHPHTHTHTHTHTHKAEGLSNVSLLAQLSDTRCEHPIQHVVHKVRARLCHDSPARRHSKARLVANEGGKAQQCIEEGNAWHR